MPETYPSAVYHLVFYKNQLTAEVKSLHYFNRCYPNEVTRPLYTLVFSNTLLTAVKFMEEYDKFFRSSDPGINANISATKRILKPAIDEVRKWSQLPAFRNHVLAHNFRIREKNNDSVFEHGGLGAFQIPNSVTDLLILMECMSMVGQFLEKKYQREYLNFAKNIPPVSQQPPPATMTTVEATQYVENISAQMLQLVDDVEDDTIRSGATRGQLSAIAGVVATKVLRYTLQLYFVKDDLSKLPARPDSTAILFELEGHFFSICAAHTYGDVTPDQVGVMINDEFISFGGDLRIYEPNDIEDHDPQKIDLAVWELTSETAAALKQKYLFLPWEKIDTHHPPVTFAAYLIAGYPASITSKHFPTKTIFPKPLTLATIGKPADFYMREQLNPDHFLAVEGTQAKVADLKTGIPTSLPPLDGLSGSGIWHVHSLSEKEPNFSLVGILTGENADQTVLFATKLNGLRRMLVSDFEVSL